MKKFTLIMSLLLTLFATTTSAQILDRSGWKVTTSSECDDDGIMDGHYENNGHANAIIDGDANTFWHSDFGNGNASGDATRTLPQFFQIDLGTVQEFNKIGYLPRRSLFNGTVTSYKVYVSNSPFENVSSSRSAAEIVNSLGTADIESTFSYEDETTATLKTYTSNKMLKGRYVLFVVMGALNYRPGYYASCAEFYLSKSTEIIMPTTPTTPTSKPLTNILDRSNWVITTSGECDDVQYNTGHANAIIDGNSETFWHSNFGGSNGSGDETCKLPQFFQVDLGLVQEFNALGYLPRSNFYNGVITSYKVYVSNTPFESVTNNRSAADVVNNLGTADYEGSFTYEGETVATLKTCRFPKMLKGRYVLFVAMESENSDYGVAYACCAEFYLAKETETTIPSSYILNRSGWTVSVSGETASDGGGKDAIIDGDNGTYWHSRWSEGAGNVGDDSRSLPQFFQIDLGSEQEFNALGYMPRPNNHNGTILDYKLYVSNTSFESVSSDKSAADIVNALGTADIESSFDYSNDGSVATLKTYTFPKMLKGRYVLFVATRTKTDTDYGYASCAEFYLAKDYKVGSCHYKVNGVEYGEKLISIWGDPTIPTMPFLTNGEITPTSDGYDIACIENTPFVAQSAFDANTAQWYALNINGESGNYLLSNKGGSIVSTTTVSLDNHPDVLEDAYLWTFVGNLKDGYRIYNKVDHKSLALYNQLILKKGDGSLFKLYEKSDNSNFGLYVDEEKLLTRESENKIIASTEDNNNDRSTFRVQDSKLYVTNYAKPFVYAFDNTEAPENAIWGFSYMNNPTNRANYRALFLAANANDATNEQIAALGAENVKIANTGGYDNTIEEGKYYRLYNAGNSRRWLNVSFNAENTSMMRCNLNAEKSVASVVNFVRLSNGYYDMKVKGLSMADVEISVVGNRFMFDNGGYLGCEEETPSFNYSEDNNTAQWFVVPATEAEIAMSEVNGKSYASAYLPFPANGVSGAEAYVGKLNDAKDMLNMTQVQGVAENTGFVLVGNADKATLSIGETTETATSDLKGSNTNIVISSPTVDLHDKYLVFGVNDGNVGFYAPSYYLETIPANKAYLEANQLASKAIAMNFGGNVTGVSQATVVANENAPIYDLSGRRVAKTVKGGVYIQNGKKFVK